MCATIGVDPLACEERRNEYTLIISINFMYRVPASKGFWSEMLGVGNFYYELGVQVIEVCMAANHRNGG